ncbi:hypothetical protein OGY07_22430 [Citrobacter sp. Cs237]|uniref:hypothetical protein n=1 Tax=Citrobacter TaxID=544 RepID=UPI001969EB48|nr:MULTISPECIES: hypothetical protein [Citrobacter]MBM9566287.1 hypothetical protein [Citrobacter sedlakii]MDM2752087.1 hypothetical protein [Citrobacter sp. Cs237]HBL4689096.1 hypothetical protein [Citrobacter sedlakii]HBL4703535.1 hypothetical protein [Citrobacter sedlakii]HBL4717633.1 hypothetical protein [Citrobacter sedlakii]
MTEDNEIPGDDIAVLPIFTHLIFIRFHGHKAPARSKAEDCAVKMVNVLLFQSINSILTVFQANKHIRALHGAPGCL